MKNRILIILYSIAIFVLEYILLQWFIEIQGIHYPGIVIINVLFYLFAFYFPILFYLVKMYGLDSIKVKIFNRIYLALGGILIVLFVILPYFVEKMGRASW